MGKSTILGIDELASGQVQAFSTVNDMLAGIEQAANAKKAISTTSDYTVADLDFVRYSLFSVTGLTADRTITFPSTVNTNTTNRLIVVDNDADYTLTVAGDVPVVIPARSSRLIHVNGTVVVSLAEGGVITGIPHTVALYASGAPTHDAEVLRYIFTEKATWAAGMTGSRGSVGTNPSPPAWFYVYKNGTKIGTVEVSTGGLFTFTQASATSWAAGDVLTVRFEALQTGSITFNSVADTGDTVVIDNGTDAPVTFTFGGGGGQVAPGASATDSATNLKTAIEASAIASTLRVTRATNVLTIVNLLAAAGGSMTKSDADNDYTIVDFTQDAASQNYGITFYGTRA